MSVANPAILNEPQQPINIPPPMIVLVVEDNQINQTILTAFLKKRNIPYGTANNGAEAVEMWRGLGSQYRLILMDWDMPIMGGLEATREIRRLEKLAADSDAGAGNASTPVHIVSLIMSGSQKDKDDARAVGCDDIWPKPLRLSYLDEKLSELGNLNVQN